MKVCSTNDKVAAVTELKNGNVQVTAKGVGTACVMFDVYDHKNHLLSHASVKVDVKTGIRPGGDSTRQIGVFKAITGQQPAGASSRGLFLSAEEACRVIRQI